VVSGEEAAGAGLRHQEILDTALARLKGKVRYQPIGFELLPIGSLLTQLQHLYETVLERPLDKRNFRKKILGMGLLIETRDTEKDVAHRPRGSTGSMSGSTGPWCGGGSTSRSNPAPEPIITFGSPVRPDWPM